MTARRQPRRRRRPATTHSTSAAPAAAASRHRCRRREDRGAVSRASPRCGRPRAATGWRSRSASGRPEPLPDASAALGRRSSSGPTPGRSPATSTTRSRWAATTSRCPSAIGAPPAWPGDAAIADPDRRRPATTGGSDSRPATADRTSSPSAERRLVPSRHCPDGHPNPPLADVCRTCGAAIDAAAPTVAVPQPAARPARARRRRGVGDRPGARARSPPRRDAPPECRPARASSPSAPTATVSRTHAVVRRRGLDRHRDRLRLAQWHRGADARWRRAAVAPAVDPARGRDRRPDLPRRSDLGVDRSRSGGAPP